MLKTAAVFSDNMVLQREKNINIWGTGDNGSIVTVTLDEHSVSTRVIDNKWMAILPSMKAGGPYVVKITDGKSSIEFSNVMIGEVWLAGGQSNMELELQNSKDGKDVVANINNNKVRFYNTLRLSYIDDEFYEKESNNAWQECSPETAGTWSAVGYYYAKKLSEELNVTVGVIGCNWGGTSASAWISRESLELDKDTNTYVEEYDKANEGRTFEEYVKELEEYNNWYEAWQKRVDKCYAEKPDILWSQVQKIAGECRWPEPLGPKSPFRAGGLYETMLQRVTPYTLRGFIYYQGESDDHKPKIYGKLLAKLIEQWRKDWQDDELPFMFVQLPMFIGREDEDKKNWAIIREQQMKVHKTIKNTGIAMILDCGEFDNIHPLDKQSVGLRLAVQSLYHVYGKNVHAYGPIYKSLKYLNNAIELSFEHAEGGIQVKGEKVEGFEIAGEDKKFIPADVKINNNKVIVSAKEVTEPKYVRYAWTNYGPVTLFNNVGLPMSTFRTSEYDEIV
ncbi:sialate O-acetylesterase [Inconstantimicrobium mannanitabidum]|uniref:9-O-acetylesterase n=1 Tax=Inconstantimicrobium mannanitabidum TaxID=1604901 RepID=A0ACB5RHM3_9CLOT|nr:sialate O-acetylesterase [Clostridium sp. TW13]GKX68611.1 9-O-acetylesterase [Clostridium sp. TW13]